MNDRERGRLRRVKRLAFIERGDFLAISVANVARALGLLLAIVAMDGGAVRAAPDASSAAQAIYAAAPPRLLQIRTLVADAGRQPWIGSGFLVSPDGLAITNYHVVSQVALEPKTYRLEYAAADGSHGDVSLLGVDLPNDLAIIRLDKHDAPYFAFDEAAMAGGLPQGERLYSMGNPLDLGFTISEGTYNGLVGHSYNERIHFTGALNPGMSGGPTVTADGLIVGINWATRRGGRICMPRSRDSSPRGSPDSTNRSAGRDFVRPSWGPTGRPRRWRRGSIAGRRPTPAPRRSRAPASIRPTARAIPACLWPQISTPVPSSSVIRMSGPLTSISSSLLPF